MKGLCLTDSGVFGSYLKINRCRGAPPFIHVPHFATSSLSGQSASDIVGTGNGENKHALHSEECSLWGGGVEGFITRQSSFLFICVGHDRRRCVLDEETHLISLRVIRL